MINHNTTQKIFSLFIILGFCLFTPNLGHGQTYNGSLTFASQQDLDDFLINHPTISKINGNVCIGDCYYPYSSSDITNLNGLQNIVEIDGDMKIRYNPSLLNFIGLDSLSIIKKGMYIGPACKLN